MRPLTCLISAGCFFFFFFFFGAGSAALRRSSSVRPAGGCGWKDMGYGRQLIVMPYEEECLGGRNSRLAGAWLEMVKAWLLKNILVCTLSDQLLCLNRPCNCILADRESRPLIDSAPYDWVVPEQWFA
jgi:hypothetical protein